eukprot:12479126-Alexandrium_andersonii.AAC.1
MCDRSRSNTESTLLATVIDALVRFSAYPAHWDLCATTQTYTTPLRTHAAQIAILRSLEGDGLVECCSARADVCEWRLTSAG